jgi:hypothetical protein
MYIFLTNWCKTPKKNRVHAELGITYVITPTISQLAVHRNIKLNVDKIKHRYWYFQQNQCLNIKKHAVHNI